MAPQPATAGGARTYGFAQGLQRPWEGALGADPNPTAAGGCSQGVPALAAFGIACDTPFRDSVLNADGSLDALGDASIGQLCCATCAMGADAVADAAAARTRVDVGGAAEGGRSYMWHGQVPRTRRAARTYMAHV